MKKVSIIIPVYNTGVYLRKCIDSILAQTMSNIEVIIIDDGSREDTAKICDEIAISDSRIQLIHKRNEGVSVARNIGLELATGEYVGFVDSDDWIELNMYETLVREIESQNADIVMCDATTIYANGKTELDSFSCLPKSCTLSKTDITPLRQLELAGSSWRVLYRTNLLKEFGIKFPVGLKFSEDRIFNMIALGVSKRFCYVKESFYNRYLREGSCVMSYHSDFVDVTLCVNDVMNRVLLKYWDESYIPFFENRNLRSIGYHTICIYNVKQLSKKEKYEAIKAICLNNELQKILSNRSISSPILNFIRNKNFFGIYLLSLFEKGKLMIKRIINK